MPAAGSASPWCTASRGNPAVVEFEKLHPRQIAGAELAARCERDRALERPAHSGDIIIAGDDIPGDG